MTTKELLHAEIDRVRPEDVAELFQLVKHFTETKARVPAAQPNDPIFNLGTQPLTVDMKDGSEDHDQYIYGV